MGWNSWDASGTTLNEAQAKAQADVDIQWDESAAKGHNYRQDARLAMGRPRRNAR
jgi:hypothetical protein